MAREPVLEPVASAASCTTLLGEAGTDRHEASALMAAFYPPGSAREVCLLVGSDRRRNRRAAGPRQPLSTMTWNARLPAGALCRVRMPDDHPLAGRLLVCSPAFEVLLRARSLDVPELALFMAVLCGTFHYAQDEPGGCRYETAPLLRLSDIDDLLQCASEKATGRKRVVTALRYAPEGCASLPEAQVALLLGLSRRLGGFGIPGLEVNYPLHLDDRARTLAQGRKQVVFDVAFPRGRIALEHDSWEFHGNRDSFFRDREKVAAAISMGYTVISTTSHTLRDFETFEALAQVVWERTKPARAREPKEDWRLLQREVFDRLTSWRPMG